VNLSALKRFLRAPQDADNSPIQMFPVSDAAVEKTEDRMGSPLPASLKSLWHEVGYGFICAREDGTGRVGTPNLLMPPSAVASASLGEGAYEGWTIAGNGIPFFDTGDGILIVIRDGGGDRGFVGPSYDESVSLASSPQEFIEKLLENPGFYMRPASPEPWER